MYISDEQDAVWAKQLAPEVYAALRNGAGEPPHTGAYEKTDLAGTYSCVGCGYPLFDSEQKIADDSGYAAFGVDEREGTVKFVRTYTESGGERTTAVCSQCGGTIGMVGTTVIYGSEDLMQGAGKRCVHAYSLSLAFRKAFTPRNHPFSYVLLLFAAALMMVVGWHVFQGVLSGTAKVARVSGETTLSVGDTHLQALVLHASDYSSTGISVGAQSLVVVLEGEGAPLRFAESVRSIDLMWLDATYTTINGQINVSLDAGEGVAAPEGARLALVTPTGTLPAEIVKGGVFVYFDSNMPVR